MQYGMMAFVVLDVLTGGGCYSDGSRGVRLWLWLQALQYRIYTLDACSTPLQFVPASFGAAGCKCIVADDLG